jgi:hypothetical protein
MGSKPVGYDDQAAAKLVLQLKAIATQEVAKIPPSCIDALFQGAVGEDPKSADMRRRTVSVGSIDMIHSSTITPVVSFIPKTLVESKSFLLDEDDGSSNGSSIDHHDWSDRVVFSPTLVKKESSTEHPLLCSPTDIIKQCKKKRESFVGLTTKAETVRATLRKKVSTVGCLCWQRSLHLEIPAFLHRLFLYSSPGSPILRYVTLAEHAD